MRKQFQDTSNGVILQGIVSDVSVTIHAVKLRKQFQDTSNGVILQGIVSDVSVTIHAVKLRKQFQDTSNGVNLQGIVSDVSSIPYISAKSERFLPEYRHPMPHKYQHDLLPQYKRGGMMKILLNGACGRMGCEVRGLLECGYRGHTLAAAADHSAAHGSGILRRLEDCTDTADLIVDFSHRSGTEALCRYAVRRRLPLVIGTTGHTENELEIVRRTAGLLPVFHASNLSLGIALLARLACTAAAALPEADIEIIEIHHARKQDAPSGTALELAEQLRRLRPNGPVVAGRRGACCRSPEEIGIHAVRLGNEAGTHTISFGSAEQTLTLTHSAHTPRLYAQGAIAAAEYLLTKPVGLYSMQQLLQEYAL